MLAEILPKLAAMEFEGQKPFYPRPSSAGPDRCIRQMVYHGLNTPPKPLPGRAILIFDDSSWHEELTADWVRKSSFTLHSEQMEVDCHEPMRKGHIDGIITDAMSTDRLWEHKAINHFTFNNFWNGNEFPEDYFTQCAVYTEGLQKDNPDLKDGLLLIKNKNTAQYMEFSLHYDRDTDTLSINKKIHSTGEVLGLEELRVNIVQDACDKFDKVLDYIKRQTLPKRQYDIDHWRCDYCQYNQTCWDGYEKEFAELKTDTMLPNEIADMVRYKKETSAHRLEMQKEEKELTEKIKQIMKDAGVREGRTPEYICKLSLRKSQTLDKHIIPQKIIDEATQISYYEKLDIRKIKEEKNGKRK